MADTLIEAKQALLADWEAKREELDSLIRALRRELGMSARTAQQPEAGSATLAATGPVNVNELVTPGDFLGLTQVDAIQQFLSRTGRKPVSPQEIAQALLRGKAVESALDEKGLKNLSSLLSKTGTFFSVARGRWGLKEWYPKSVIDKREAKKAEKSNGKEES